jgi:hypothetical protein
VISDDDENDESDQPTEKSLPIDLLDETGPIDLNNVDLNVQPATHGLAAMIQGLCNP